MANEVQSYVVPVPPEVKSGVESATTQAGALAVIDERSLNEATAVLANLTAVKKQAEEARQFLVRPLNDHIKAINNVFKQTSAPVEAAIAQIKGQVSAYQRKRQAEAAAAQRRLEEQAEAERAAAEFAGVSAEIVAPQVAAPASAVHTVSGSAVIKKAWDYEVEDLQLLAAYVGREGSAHLVSGEVTFVEPNRGALRKAINAGVREIPGVRIFQKDDVAVTTRG